MRSGRDLPIDLVRGFAVLLLLLNAGAPPSAWAQATDNAGTEFFVGFLPNWDEQGGMTTELHLTSGAPTEVTVHYPAGAPTFTATVAVGPDTVTVVDLGTAPAFGWDPGTVGDNAVRAFADDEFVAYAVNRREISTDVAVALPVDALGTEYLVQTYPPFHRFSAFAVVAAHDNTTVTVTPTREMVGGYAAGAPFEIALDRGEGFLGQSAVSRGPEGDLTGTLVEADRPVHVSNGNGCTLVPTGFVSCDHLFEIAHPVPTWGLEAVAAPVPDRPGGSVYRVLASEDGTAVWQNGTPVDTLDRGEFFEAVAPGAQVFRGDRPISVTQLITSNSYGNTGEPLGDPSMVSVLPAERYLRRYTFATVGSGLFDQHFLSVLAEDADVAAGAVILDGAPVPAADFTSIPGTGRSYAVVPIAEGVHTTSSERPHGITVGGYADFHSYLYPGGATFADPAGTPTEAAAGRGPRLEANRPNPFRLATRIPFRLGEAGPAAVRVYDVLGREVVTLVEADLPAGAHEVEWDGRDAAGQAVPSGVYLYRVEAGAFTAARPLTLTR